MRATRKLVRTLRRRLLSHEDGATAVEFAIVAAPFLALILLIMETGLHHYSGSNLDTALRGATRAIQVGSAQESRLSQEAFKKEVCGRLPVFMTCDRVHIDVRTIGLGQINGFQISGFVEVEADGTVAGVERVAFMSRNKFCPGSAGDFVLARAAYVLPVLFPFSMTEFVKIAGKTYYFVDAARIFRNEPFLAGGTRC